MKAIKYISFFIAGLIALILILFFGLILFFNPNNYKAEIENLVKEKANIELNIEGDINWTFYPWLGISIQNTSAASTITPEKPFAKIKELDLSVKLLPLFSGKIQMNDVNLDGLIISLEKDANGQTNWDKVGEIASTEGKPTENKDKQEPKETSKSKLDLNISSVTINNTQINYKDPSKQYTIKNVHISTGAISAEAPILIKLGADLNSTQPQLATTFNLQGQLTYNLEQQRYQVNTLQLTSNISGEPLNGKSVSLSATGNLLADLKANTAQWDKLHLNLNTLKIKGSLKANNITDNPTVTGNLTAETFSLRKLLDELGVSLPAMANSKALTEVNFSTNLKASTKNATFNDLVIKLDSTNLKGTIAITDLVKQAIQIQLEGDNLNIDNYLPPETASSKTTNTTTTSTTGGRQPTTNQMWSNEPLLDTASLRNLNLDISFNMAQFTVKKLPWQGFVAKITAKNGLINLQKLGGRLFNGSINLQGSLNANSNTPQISIQPRIDNIPIEKLLASQGNKTPIKGSTNLTANLVTSGISQASLVKNLNGTVNFAVANGALIGENLEYQVCKGVALVRKKTLTSKFNKTETAFNQLKGSFKITNGVANNQDLIISVAGFEAKGKGSLNIPSMMVDYKIGLSLKGEQSANGDPACKVGEDVADISFPLLCKGSVLAGGNLCNIDPDGIGQLALDIGKNKVKETLNKEKEKINKKLEKKLGDKAPIVNGILDKLLK